MHAAHRWVHAHAWVVGMHVGVRAHAFVLSVRALGMRAGVERTAFDRRRSLRRRRASASAAAARPRMAVATASAAAPCGERRMRCSRSPRSASAAASHSAAACSRAAAAAESRAAAAAACEQRGRHGGSGQGHAHADAVRVARPCAWWAWGARACMQMSGAPRPNISPASVPTRAPRGRGRPRPVGGGSASDRSARRGEWQVHGWQAGWQAARTCDSRGHRRVRAREAGLAACTCALCHACKCSSSSAGAPAQNASPTHCAAVPTPRRSSAAPAAWRRSTARAWRVMAASRRASAMPRSVLTPAPMLASQPATGRSRCAGCCCRCCRRCRRRCRRP